MLFAGTGVRGLYVSRKQRAFVAGSWLLADLTLRGLALHVGSQRCHSCLILFGGSSVLCFWGFKCAELSLNPFARYSLLVSLHPVCWGFGWSCTSLLAPASARPTQSTPACCAVVAAALRVAGARLPVPPEELAPAQGPTGSRDRLRSREAGAPL